MINDLIEKFKTGAGGEIKINKSAAYIVEKTSNLFVGRNYVKAIITVDKEHTVIDGGGAELTFDVEDCTGFDYALFYFGSQARYSEVRNLRIRVNVLNQTNSEKTFAAFYNTAYGVKFINCHIEIYAKSLINAVGVYNNGNLDTHMETRADHVSISGCFFKIDCRAENFDKPAYTAAFYNYLANSVSFQDNYVFSFMDGVGENQRAVGVYTNGRFGRIIGNNIKANGTQMSGKVKEHAHAFGIINDGNYTIIAANNVVAEWAGKSVAVLSLGEYAKISGNKLLATHTLVGRCAVVNGKGATVIGNTLTSTGRNVRFIELTAPNVIISENYMECLLPLNAMQRGCGVYAADKAATGSIISNNVIKTVKTCGLFLNPQIGMVSGNLFALNGNAVEHASSADARMLAELDETMVCTIRE